ncbi:MAG: energy transducer TonB [Gammaproteobacteria bacterium]|nr:energy transducer TonB [Gammaproteobacteria bacterium]
MHSLKIFLSRYSLAISFALVTTTGLVLLMEYLIRSDESGYEEVADIGTIQFVRLLEDEEVKIVDRRPEEIPPPEIPPPAPEPVVGETDTGTLWVLPAPQPKVPPAAVDPGPGDGDLLPIVKVMPVYPRIDQTRGIEGYVIIQFTVDELGRVVDPVVVDAMPDRVFNKAALEAVRRYKYKPRVVNGTPTSVTGLQQRLTFELT